VRFGKGLSSFELPSIQDGNSMDVDWYVLISQNAFVN
jgi:hypothetical protein